MTYTLTNEEASTSRIDSDTLSRIGEDIRTRGYAVVANLVSEESRQLLMNSVLEDAEMIRGSGEMTDHEKRTGKGHLQLGLRRRAPYVRGDLVANPAIEAIVAEILGEGAWLGFYNGNVNLPGSTHQPLHFDRPFSWKTEAQARAAGEEWPPRATTLSCSVALQEIKVENGATEIYPGTHKETAVTDWPLGERPENHPELIERWAPPARMAIPAGGVCFRDPRMWHRGMPNPSNQIRPMMALTYHAGICRHWRGLLAHDMSAEDIARCDADPTLRVMDDGSLGDGRMVFEESARPVFEAHPSQYGIVRYVRFVEEVDHTQDAHLMGGARVLREASA
jgi:ectoine hydroxylase-related dioxygenase (phytanoyl-CoA dioxygenase family)